MSADGHDWTAFGRVDTDGTVYVKTSAGERVVGSWQAGSPEEGLAHFARRFADLVTEVDLLAARLNSGTADPQHTVAAIRKIREGLDEAHVVGDLDGLATRLDELASRAGSKADEAAEAKASARAEALTRKEALVAEAEQLAESSTQWKATGDRFKTIVDEWKTIHGVERKADTALWRRFAAARDAFTRRRGAHFATLDAERKTVQARKEELIAQAEQLSRSEDWNETAAALKGLMDDWKAAGRAGKDVEQKLWQRFRAAQDVFFNRRSEVFTARDNEFKDNLAKKRELLAEAEALDVEADAKTAQIKLREIQGQWHEVGRVPRENTAGLQKRLRAVENKVRDAIDVAWRRTSIEDNPLLAQMRQQVEEAERKLEKAKEAGDSKRIKEAEASLAGKRQFLELAQKSA